MSVQRALKLKGPIADLLLATCGIVKCGRVPAGRILDYTCVYTCVNGTGREDLLENLAPLESLALQLQQ